MTTLQNRLRLWPGVLIVTLTWLVRFGLPVVAPDTLPYAVGGGLLGGLMVFGWWVFFSRAQAVDRWGGLALIVVGLGVSSQLLHASIAKGMMGLMFPIYAIPAASLGLVVWAVLSRDFSTGLRRATMVVSLLVACGVDLGADEWDDRRSGVGLYVALGPDSGGAAIGPANRAGGGEDSRSTESRADSGGRQGCRELGGVSRAKSG